MPDDQLPPSRRAVQAEAAAAVLQGFDAATHDFMHHWVAFNAFYGHDPGPERDRLLECVADGLDEPQARSLLHELADTVAYLSALPPGDGRRRPNDPHFRRRAAEDLRRANDPSLPSARRVAHLVASVYQVRCNLFHGAKTPALNPRDAALVEASLRVTKAVVGALLEGASLRDPEPS